MRPAVSSSFRNASSGSVHRAASTIIFSPSRSSTSGDAVVVSVVYRMRVVAFFLRLFSTWALVSILVDSESGGLKI
jgi:hypothetical protein